MKECGFCPHSHSSNSLKFHVGLSSDNATVSQKGPSKVQSLRKEQVSSKSKSNKLQRILEAKARGLEDNKTDYLAPVRGLLPVCLNTADHHRSLQITR